MTEAGLRLHLADAPHVPPEPAAEAAITYLGRTRRSRAVFCANDAIAIAPASRRRPGRHRRPGPPLGRGL